MTAVYEKAVRIVSEFRSLINQYSHAVSSNLMPSKKTASSKSVPTKASKSVIRPASKNRSLGNARTAKEDEFYTQLSDIERELRHYKQHFKNKIIYLNCDDPRVSNFFHYFTYNFEALGLKKVIATCYKNQNIDLFSQNDKEKAIWLEYNGDLDRNGVPDLHEIGIHELQGDGDFRSEESIAFLQQADIVVTNPPFSLFSEYVAQLVQYDKKFLIVGNQNEITYKEIFKLIRDGQMWLGHQSGDMKFRVPDYYKPRPTRYWVDDEGNKWRSFGNACWFTNLDISKRHEELVLYKTYNPIDYPKFDFYDAIAIGRVTDIPIDFAGVMGVPITFLSKHNPNQFEIIGLLAGNIKGLAGIPSSTGKDGPYINGKLKYGRILIRRKESS